MTIYLSLENSSFFVDYYIYLLLTIHFCNIILSKNDNSYSVQKEYTYFIIF